jgi:hypothetical protein
MLRRRHQEWNVVKTGAKAARTAVKVGAKVAKTAERAGARAATPAEKAGAKAATPAEQAGAMRVATGATGGPVPPDQDRSAHCVDTVRAHAPVPEACGKVCRATRTARNVISGVGS